MRSFHRVHHGAIKLIEAVVLLGIIVFLLLLLLPAVNKLGPCGGNRVACANHLKHIGLALHNYSDMHLQFPAGTIPNPNLEPNERLSWLVELLPYLEEDALYRQFDQSAAWDGEANLPLSHSSLRIFQCPAWKANPWETPYVGIAGVGSDAANRAFGDPKIGVFGYDRRVAFADVKDGTSHTLMVLESTRDTDSWTRGGFTTVRGVIPEDKPYVGSSRPFGGTHVAGSNALMMDGSVWTLSDRISPEVVEALATIAGGEKIAADQILD
jgi:hypothetical protein